MNENLKQTLEEQRIEDLAGKRALAEPFPGPLKDAFSMAPDIIVGPYKVRRFRDGDFKLLSALNSQFMEFIRGKLMGDEAAQAAAPSISGQDAWDVCLAFTIPAKDCKEIIESQGVEGFRKQSEEQFGEFRLAGLSAIVNAVIKQARIYGSANIEYGEAKTEGEQSSNPPSSAAQ